MASAVLGVDPGIDGTGWSVFTGWGNYLDSGSFHPGRKEPMRFDYLADFIQRAIRGSEIADVIVEVPGKGLWTKGHRLLAYGRSVGIVEATAHLAGARVHRITTNRWKANKPKFHNLHEIRGHMSRDPVDSHEADAVGLVLFWFQTERKSVFDNRHKYEPIFKNPQRSTRPMAFPPESDGSI